MNKKEVIAIIPARYGSTRLQGKPLLGETGKAMICHVVDQVKKARLVADVIVATDDERILEAVEAYGGRAVMTRADHINGTSRIAEVVEGLGDEVDIVVNVQGDEPELEPMLIDKVVDRLVGGDEPMATLASRFDEGDDAGDPNLVKVVLDRKGCAMYFSRSVIPYDRDNSGVVLLKHVGLYAYRRDFLCTYVKLAPTPAEGTEKLEQLRALEHGYGIGVVVVGSTMAGIDTAEQYAAFVERYKNKTA